MTNLNDSINDSTFYFAFTSESTDLGESITIMILVRIRSVTDVGVTGP